MRFFCLSILFIMLSAAACAQNIGDYWYNSNHREILILCPNGNYLLQEGGQIWTTGAYSIKGNTLNMSGSLGNIMHFRINAYNNNYLQLLNSNNSRINFFQVPQTYVYAKNGRQELTSKQIKIVIEILQFIIRNQLQSSELQQIIEECVTSFKKNPAEFESLLKTLKTKLLQIQSTRDMLDIADLRHRMLGVYYYNFQEDPSRATINIIERYCKILAYDPKNNFILTNKDLQAYLNIIVSAHKKQTYNVMSKKNRERLKKYILQNFLQFSPKIRFQICLAEIISYSPHYSEQIISSSKYIVSRAMSNQLPRENETVQAFLDQLQTEDEIAKSFSNQLKIEAETSDIIFENMRRDLHPNDDSEVEEYINED